MLPHTFVIFDTEFTAWKGSHERGWSAPGEHREIIQIGAVQVRALEEVDSYSVLVAPRINPELSQYITELTGITQHMVEMDGVSFGDALTAFSAWSADLPCYSYGHDGAVIEENCELLGVPFPFDREQFRDVREVFAADGVDTSQYMSSTIPRAYGLEPPPDGHDARNDARSILLALKARQ